MSLDGVVVIALDLQVATGDSGLKRSRYWCLAKDQGIGDQLRPIYGQIVRGRTLKSIPVIQRKFLCKINQCDNYMLRLFRSVT